MESFCTDFNGFTRCIPSGSVSPVTRPNSVSTPTFPVGMDVVLAINRMITSTRIANCNILFPAPPKFILGIPSPPRSNLVVVGICPSVLQLIRANFEPHHPQSLTRKQYPYDFLAGPHRPAVSTGPIFHSSQFTGLPRPCRDTNSPATLPQYLVVFSLDTTGRSRQNPRHHVRCSRAPLMSVAAAVFGTRFFTVGARQGIDWPGELRTFSIAAKKRPTVVRSHRN